jgi:hypothetical protein
MAKLIGESIKHLIARKKEPPSISKRREELRNRYQKEAVDNPTNDDNTGTYPESTISPMKHGETQAQLSKPLPTTLTNDDNKRTNPESTISPMKRGETQAQFRNPQPTP